MAFEPRRYNRTRYRRLPAQKIKRADAEFVWLHTGTAPGGVPPVGHPMAPMTLLDRNLQRYPAIWAAGGSPNAVFASTSADLARLTAAEFTGIAK